MAQASAPGWITLTLGLLALLTTLAFFDDTSLLPQASASEDAWPDRMLVGMVSWLGPSLTRAPFYQATMF